MYDLWVLPTATHSQWFARIDWYLNWQMSKGLAHQRQKPSLELHRVMEETGFTFAQAPETPTAPLMVSSMGKVDAGRCVVVEFKRELRPWLQIIYKMAEGLKTKHMRVFLPTGSTVADANEIWKKLPTLELEIEFSTDEETK
jgi:hypothetical protein